MTPAHSPVALRYRGATHLTPYSYPTRRSSDLSRRKARRAPDAHLQIARRLVQHLSLAASWKREAPGGRQRVGLRRADRKSTRLNSSHLGISYAVFCLKKKNVTDGTSNTVSVTA